MEGERDGDRERVRKREEGGGETLGERQKEGDERDGKEG